MLLNYHIHSIAIVCYNYSSQWAVVEKGPRKWPFKISDCQSLQIDTTKGRFTDHWSALIRWNQTTINRFFGISEPRHQNRHWKEHIWHLRLMVPFIYISILWFFVLLFAIIFTWLSQNGEEQIWSHQKDEDLRSCTDCYYLEKISAGSSSYQRGS